VRQFGILVIGIWNLFGIWYLDFMISSLFKCIESNSRVNWNNILKPELLAYRLGLDRGDGDSIDNIGDRTAPAEIVDRLVQTLENRADRDGIG